MTGQKSYAMKESKDTGRSRGGAVRSAHSASTRRWDMDCCSITENMLY